MKYQLELEWHIVLDSRWHIGSGLGGGLIDRTVMRDYKRLPFIPGSTLKGIIRESCEKIAASLGFKKIKDPNDDQGIENFMPASESNYIVDRLFGSKFSGENLFFRNVFAELKQDEEFQEMAITRNQRDRLNQVTKSKHLYSTEEILPANGLNFGRVHISAVHDQETLTPARDKKEDKVMLGKELSWPIEYSLLLAGIFMTERLGSSKSRGLGNFHIDMNSISIVLNGNKVNLPLTDLLVFLGNDAECREESQSMEEVMEILERRIPAEPTPDPLFIPLTTQKPQKKVKITATPLSGFSIFRNRSSQMAEVLDYIPGSTLRGALAKLYINHYGYDQTFAEFVSSHNSFGDLLPSIDGQPNMVLPDTAMSCKRKPGDGEDKHGIYDFLFLHAAEHLAKQQGKPLLRDQIEPFSNCRRCDNMMKEHSGYLHHSRTDKAFYVHVGIDRLTRTASPKILYGIEAVQPLVVGKSSQKNTSDGKQLYFIGTACLEETLLQRFQKLQQDSNQHLFVGHSKTRGYGELKWKMECFPDESQTGGSQASFTKHLESFNAKFHRFCQEQFGLNLPNDMFYFALGMASHTVIVDTWLRYTCEPQAVLDSLQLKGCQPIWNKASLVQIRGWQQKHALPKEDEFAIKRGSVYLLGTQCIPETIEQLWQISNSNAGLRGEEGFGRLIVSNNFHLSHLVEGKP